MNYVGVNTIIASLALTFVALNDPNCITSSVEMRPGDVIFTSRRTQLVTGMHPIFHSAGITCAYNRDKKHAYILLEIHVPTDCVLYKHACISIIIYIEHTK